MLAKFAVLLKLTGCIRQIHVSYIFNFKEQQTLILVFYFRLYLLHLLSPSRNTTLSFIRLISSRWIVFSLQSVTTSTMSLMVAEPLSLRTCNTLSLRLPLFSDATLPSLGSCGWLCLCILRSRGALSPNTYSPLSGFLVRGSMYFRSERWTESIS